ncbi:phage terminase small subunit [Serratia ureilytica]|uniref:Terminase n=1 Tax=Serratia ureilytica TaxID=300181 RepID=A0A9X9G1E4_9GAMM|nr:phage terminase small subunit [Serratia ureilytica]TXE26922.1 terminase [Serratia ureilytica]
MLTPAAKRRQQVLAARLATDDTDVRANDEHALMLMQLHQDKQMLSQIASNQAKAEAKRRILPNYDAWVESVLENGAGAQDDILINIMVWRIDAGDIAGALDIADYALAHNLRARDDFERSTACLVTEEIANQTLASLEAEGSPDADQLLRLRDMTEGHDMPDQVRAKLYKALGRTLRNDGDNAGALEAFNRALALHDKSGVKLDIKALLKEQG